MEFQSLLILMYFNSAKDQYSYKDLVGLLGLTYGLVEELVNKLIDDSLLFVNCKNIICITESGLSRLIENGFEEVNLFKLYQNPNESIINEKYLTSKMDINEIYIPTNFHRKFKGYIENT